MLTYEEAYKEIIRNSLEPKYGKVSIIESCKYFLAEDIISNDDIPINDNSAMDGYAVNTLDLADATQANPVLLTLSEHDIAAGVFERFALKRGTCIKIMTGAPVPSGCDCVIKKEDVKIIDTKIVFFKVCKPFENIRRKGEDIKKGETVFKKGEKIYPASIGVMASLGITEVLINTPPVIGIISTGNELVDAGDDLSFGKVRDSNGYSLASQVKEAGARYVRYGIVKDSKDEIARSIKNAASECDIILISGGVSVGDYDYIKEILNKLNADEIFWGIKQKPGKPMAFYKLGKKLIFGLPGNPVSVMVCFELYVRPLIRKMLGFKYLHRNIITAHMKHPFRHETGRTEFVRVVLEKDSDYNYFASVTGQQGSGILSSMAKADGIAEVEADQKDIKEGDKIKVFVIKDEL